jgi:hypothetical protein
VAQTNHVADEFRVWLQERFGNHRIRLVGDSCYAGYALEFET